MAAPLFPADAVPLLKGFKAFELDTARNPVPAYNRLDFYKVSLVTGHIVVQYADRNLELKGTHLFFANPLIPYSTLLLSARVTGYTCLFTEEFMKGNGLLDSLQHFSLFEPGGLPVGQLDDAQASYSVSVFEKMIAAQNLDYPYKRELICSYLQLLLHEGLRMQRWETLAQPYPAATGSTSLLPG